MSIPTPGSVLVVAPDLTRGPDTFGDLVAEIAARPGRIAVRARPGTRRPRLADLTADVLDALGRVGTASVARRVTSADPMHLVPFLVTDAVTDLVVFNAGWLGVPGLEELTAASAVATVRLWLVLGETPTPDLATHLAAHCADWISLEHAATLVGGSHPAPRGWSAHAVGYAVATGRITSDAARTQVAARLAALTGERARAFADEHTRLTVRPAVEAFHALGITNPHLLAALRVRQLTPGAGAVLLSDETIAVPDRLRRPLHRQYLHARVVGQRPEDQLLTHDGSVTTAGGLNRAY